MNIRREIGTITIVPVPRRETTSAPAPKPPPKPSPKPEKEPEKAPATPVKR